jgi:hypothetical protein
MNLFFNKYGFLVSLNLLLGIISMDAQQIKKTVIFGTILDAQTKDPIPYANIIFVGKRLGATSNLDGKFTLLSIDTVSKIQISYMGYKTKFLSVKVRQTQRINIMLDQDVKTINEVVIKPSKKRYKNKANPAVELIQQVIGNKGKNRISDLDYLEFEKYEKIEFALSNIDDKFKQRRIFKKFQFVFDNMDSTKIKGKQILPFYLKENLSNYYYRKNPKKIKEIQKGNKMVSFSEYMDDQGIANYMNYLYQDIDIYNNNIILLTNQFLSPVASTAPMFYKFYISDTTLIDGQKCINIFFSPQNKTDLLFQGNLYIVADSSHAIKKIDMSVNKDINLNWVREMKIRQVYDSTSNGKYVLSSAETAMDFGLSKNNKGIFGQRSVSYKNYKINEPIPDNVFAANTEATSTAQPRISDNDWNKLRHKPLTSSEQGIYMTMDSVKKVPAFKNAMNLFVLVFSGYRDLGYFEIGPVSTFYSYNPIEGPRVRFGGRTTNKLSKKINFDTYLAYGTTDKLFKYYGGFTFSLTSRSCFEFPVKSLKVSYQKETKIPGQELQFIQEDNILLSIKRGINDKLLYNKSFRTEHLNEFKSHFSYTIGYEYTCQSPAGSLFFNTSDYQQHINTNLLNISEITVGIRYAPHESFYQGKLYRIPIINKYPIFQFQYGIGNKIFGNDYNYHRLKLNIYKRFYLSVLGYTDATWDICKIFGNVPYPLLFIHRANQTYSYQLASYNLMNFLEFVSDQYSSLNIDHCFNGLLFNRIPLFKKLKFREVATFKIIYGSVSKQNKALNTQNLYKFPIDDLGNPITYSLDKKPYIETSVGISNIFRFFRIDLVNRLTYLDHPNVAPTGIRMRFKFDF